MKTGKRHAIWKNALAASSIVKFETTQTIVLHENNFSYISLLIETAQTIVLYENNFSYVSLLFPRVVCDSVFECSNIGGFGSNPTQVTQTCVHFPPAFVVLCRWIPSLSRTYPVTARMYPCKHSSLILFTRMSSVIGLHYKITLLQYVSPDRFLLPLRSEFLSLMYE